MLSITHIVVCLLLIQILSLDRNDAFLGLLFGVAIDLDHLQGLTKYTEAKGLSGLFDIHSLMNPGGHWKSILHTPIAAALVTPLSVVSRLAVPAIFWAVHILMDFAEQNYLGNFSYFEAALLCVAGLALVTLRYSKQLESYSGCTLKQYFTMEFENVKRMTWSRDHHTARAYPWT